MYEFRFLQVLSYCLAHHPGISSNITNAAHFSTPPAPPTLAQQPPYPRRYTTNGLSPIIMNEVFNFQKNERCNLRSGIHLASTNRNIAHFRTDTISSLGPKKSCSQKISQYSKESCRPATLLKRDSNTDISSEYCKIFKNSYFEEHLLTVASAFLKQLQNSGECCFCIDSY